MKKSKKTLPKPQSPPYPFPIGSINIQLDGIPELTSKERYSSNQNIELEISKKRQVNESVAAGGNLCCIICITLIGIVLFGLITIIPILVTILNETTTTTNISKSTSSSPISPTLATSSSSPTLSTTLMSSTNPSSSGTVLSTITTVLTTTTICPNMTCTFNAIASPMSPYHGVEHLDINCSQSLSAMRIQIIVQRTVGASYSSQYNTFWSSTTNETYITNSTHIIYTWMLFPGQIIQGSGFPYFVEGQYSLPNVNQTTNLDTYDAQLTSICGDTITSSGQF